MSEQAERSRAQIRQMINETELVILGKRDVLKRFEIRYPIHEVQRMRQRIAIHEQILRLLKDIEGKTRP